MITIQNPVMRERERERERERFLPINRVRRQRSAHILHPSGFPLRLQHQQDCAQSMTERKIFMFAIHELCDRPSGSGLLG